MGMLQATDFITGKVPVGLREHQLNGPRAWRHMRANHPDATATTSARPARTYRCAACSSLIPEAGAQCSAMIKASRAPGITNSAR
jgi:hypothetical protein